MIVINSIRIMRVRLFICVNIYSLKSVFFSSLVSMSGLKHDDNVLSLRTFCPLNVYLRFWDSTWSNVKMRIRVHIVSMRVLTDIDVYTYL